MMKKLSIIFFCMLLSVATVQGAEREENSDWHFKGRVGYSIGGTAPIGMPATIRDATVKSYYMDLVRGGQSLDGRFTGRVITDARQWMFTVPVNATFQPSDRVLLYAGPYLSVLTSKSFEGNVYNGYLRKGNPTGEKVEMGEEESTRGYYDFSDDMRPLQFGLNIGADWRVWHQFGLYANLSWGLTGMFKSDFKTVEQTLYPIYGTIGIVYQIK